MVSTNGIANGVVVEKGNGAAEDHGLENGKSHANGRTEIPVVSQSNGHAEKHISMKEVVRNGAEKAGRHAGVGEKTILSSPALNEYILKTTVYPREHEQLLELRLMTAKHRWNLMLSSADEGQFLQVLLKLMNAKNTIEIGTYTGYSLLATALALPADGKIVAMDLNRNCLDLGWPYIEKAGVADKITFFGGLALDSLNRMLDDDSNHNHFDFVFVDADKNNYMNYHECLLKLVRVGGVIAYDNTLWNGSVVASEEELAAMPKYVRFYHPFIKELNEFLARDSRVEPAMLSIGDGVTLCRKVS